MNDLVAMIAPVSSNMAKALTGPAAALALRLLGRAVLGDEDASPETIADALKNEDPDVRLKIARAEADFQRQAGDVQIELVRLANQNFADARQALIQMETVAANDRANARQRQQITNDRTNAYLAYIVTISFVLVILLVIRLQIGGNDTPVLNTLLGVLGTGWASIMTFYFGSSVGSREKTAVLGEATIQSKNVGVGSPTGLEGTQDGAR